MSRQRRFDARGYRTRESLKRMGSPPSPKTGPATIPPAVESPALLPILVGRKVLTAEQAERARLSVRGIVATAEQAVFQLGMANEVQIGPALAAPTGLPSVKINPLDLALDAVTKGVSGAFARRHGLVAISKSA